MVFNKELDFEKALIRVLCAKGWESEIIKNPTEEDLITNWANILFENNRNINRLGDYPLTRTEMNQIIDQIINLRTPLQLNSFINGKTVAIKRDNPDDKLHYGKEVSLKIYDRDEIAAGQSRYQIVEQPILKTNSKLVNDRRGDLMLLINGMPVIHIELKKSGIPISEAEKQICKYAYEGVYTGIYSLVQIFVAMNPEESVYYANPGPDGKFNENYYFHWADFNNEPINNWKDVASTLLSIPMAHQLIGFYTVADSSDGVLKVMRSYQYYAASAISDKVSKTKWDEGNQRGGFIWHTTGSGKTMTSFKSAELIANSKDADKVIFLTDRLELGTQSLKEYKGFADCEDYVQATENTRVLISKLTSEDPKDTLIVTSIQKMSNIKYEEDGLNERDIQKISSKRLVFIVDEAHRSTFGEMLFTIKTTFPNALFFGFTGTPIQKENQKKNNTTAMVFGNELHRYSIADGIRDKNVLGFDPYMVKTYKDGDIRKAVALEQAKAKTEEEVFTDTKKEKKYYEYMDSSKIPMAGHEESGKYVKGIEDYVSTSQYTTEEHQRAVVSDIIEHWNTYSHNSKFHAIFATSSITEAIKYYQLFKEMKPSLRVTCLFDPNIDNKGGFKYKEEGLKKILDDYNNLYGSGYDMAKHAEFKKDVAFRLAHKENHKGIERTPEKQLDLLIVVDQMLTGFDSKWVNTLYLDKVIEYESIIQAFSRTNRLFGNDKPFGVIRYYRKTNTMARNIKDAVKLYSGDKPLELFVDKLPKNLEGINTTYKEIKELFTSEGIKDFEKVPDDNTVSAKFVSLFNDLNEYLDAAKVQGFVWDKEVYKYDDPATEEHKEYHIYVTKREYDALLQRYKELSGGDPDTTHTDDDIPYDLKSYIVEIDSEKIDSDYMNSRFRKYLKELNKGSSPEVVEKALSELHQSFASLSQEDQKYANIFLHDVQSGEIDVQEDKTLRDYINEYKYNAKNDQTHEFAETFGLDEGKLRAMMELNLNELNINEFGRLDDLKKSVDKQKARAYFESVEGAKVLPYKVNIRMDSLLRKFILSGGFELGKS
ncbi:HsdR family type I site-specific deoxyribonuclease [uncultured Catenibacterium sp.]|uniref:type I restriction endonuclease subunit R n=1 Tax=uncultured Catenibacterium sp. TaxID=286142 RepID=UPI0025E592F7|nr:HsdR family type I site-specific deoxyribonuclease [uncultured Catenibacterium sp.]